MLTGEKKESKYNSFKSRNPGEWQIPYENVTLKTSDNITLKGWFLK